MSECLMKNKTLIITQPLILKIIQRNKNSFALKCTHLQNKATLKKVSKKENWAGMTILGVSKSNRTIYSRLTTSQELGMPTFLPTLIKYRVKSTS